MVPIPLTPLVGREHDVAAVRHQMMKKEVRLLALTGPGGVGKTRLAIEVATELREAFADGAIFVPLASLSDPALVLVTIARTLGLPHGRSTSLVRELAASLQAREVLLVLDNFEQLGAAGAAVVDLLTLCAEVSVLITSRTALHLHGEHDYPVLPLTQPDPQALPPIEQLAHYGAVRLFVDRAQAVQPGFVLTPDNAAAVAAICRRLDGLPLAIELAAARSALLAPQALLARLEQRLPLLTGGGEDAPLRQRTLRATLAWSETLLPPAARTLFRRLAVFAGGWTLAAAEAVCATSDTSPTSCLDDLGTLLDHSLMHRLRSNDEPRFAMLGTVREYAWDALVESGEMAAIRQRHSDYYAALADEAAAVASAPDQAAWLRRLEQERDNLRAALAWAHAQGAAALGLRLAAALRPFWHAHGATSGERTWLDDLLVLRVGRDMAGTRARALLTAGDLVRLRGDHEQALARYEEALALLRGLGDRRLVAHALNQLGILAYERGEFRRAVILHEESFTLQQLLADTRGMADSLNHLAIVLANQGCYSHAVARYEEGLTLHRAAGNTLGTAQSLDGLGWIAMKQGDPGRAVGLYTESLAMRRDLGDWQMVAYSLDHLGTVAHLHGDAARAAALLEESLTLHRAVGGQRGTAWTVGQLANLASRQCEHARAAALYEESLHLHTQSGNALGTAEVLADTGRAALRRGDRTGAQALLQQSMAAWQRIGTPLGSVGCLEGMAEVAMACHHAERAAWFLGAAAAARAAWVTPAPPTERHAHEQMVAAGREALGEQSWASAWTRGSQVTLEQVLVAALAGSI